ncbi:MAG: glycosyltransferase family 9 protein [Agarilytica sp.]
MSGQTLLAKTPPNSICILRLSAIGDVCHAVSMVQSIQRRWPEAKITWVVGKIEATLLAGLANVELVVFDKRGGFSSLLALRTTFKKRRFDVLLHMQAALRASVVSTCIPAKIKVGFDKARAREGQWLFTNAQVKAQSQPHVLEGFATFAEILDVPAETPQWDMPISTDDERWAEDHLPGSGPFAVISPAASKAERNWTVEGYVAAAAYLHAKGYTVVLTGGPSEMEQRLSADITQGCEFSLVDLVGKTKLKQLLAVLKKARLVIAPDTGPAHMAVTVGTPVIGLYAHSNPRRTGPYLYQDYAVNVYDDIIQQQKNSHWESLPWNTRAKGEDLMQSISVDAVIEKVDAVQKDFYSSSDRASAH